MKTCSLGDGRPVHLSGMCQPCARAYNKWWSHRRASDIIAWAARRALKLHRCPPPTTFVATGIYPNEKKR